jgi:hypothetical protein
MRGNGVLLGGTLALLFSANAVLVLFYGLIGVSGNSLVTGGFLVASEIIILLLSFRRSLVLVPADYLFGAFLICVAISFAVNGRTADVKEWGLVAVSLFAYPVCRLCSGSQVSNRIRVGIRSRRIGWRHRHRDRAHLSMVRRSQ